MILDFFIIVIALALYVSACIALTNWFDYKSRLKAACKLYEGAKALLQPDEQDCVERFLNIAALSRGKTPPYPGRGLRGCELVVNDAFPPRQKKVEVLETKQLPGNPGLLRGKS